MSDAAIPVGRLGSGAGVPRLFRAVADCFAAEGDRRLLWLPVIFGTGIALYFAVTFEPPLWPAVAAATAGLGWHFFCAGIRPGAKRRLPSWPWRQVLR